MKLDFRRRGEQGLFRQSAAPRRPITPTPQQWRAALSSHCGKAETQNGEWSRVTMSLRGRSGLEIQTAWLLPKLIYLLLHQHSLNIKCLLLLCLNIHLTHVHLAELNGNRTKRRSFHLHLASTRIDGWCYSLAAYINYIISPCHCLSIDPDIEIKSTPSYFSSKCSLFDSTNI